MPRWDDPAARAARNKEIFRLKKDGMPNKELSRAFGLRSGYITEIFKEEERLERFRDSPESLGPLSVGAFVMLARAGIASQNALLAYVREERGWKETLKSRFKATDRMLEDIEGFVSKLLPYQPGPDLGAGLKTKR